MKDNGNTFKLTDCYGRNIWVEKLSKSMIGEGIMNNSYIAISMNDTRFEFEKKDSLLVVENMETNETKVLDFSIATKKEMIAEIYEYFNNLNSEIV